MCGIAGVSWNDKDNEFSTRAAAVGLLRGIASRGPDATGAAWYQPVEDAVALTKVPVPAWRFIEAREERIPEDSPTMILHTRFATHGSVNERVNNHPIQHDNIIGVHNGVLQNDDEIFEELKQDGVTRNGEVDSEAIFALIGLTTDVTRAFELLLGDAAVAWIDVRKPEELHLAKVVGRPLYVAQTQGGSFLFASTQTAVDTTLKTMGVDKTWGEEMRDGHYMRVVNGVVLDYLPLIGIQGPDKSWSERYSWTSGEGASKTTDADDETPMWMEDDDAFEDLIAQGKVGHKSRTEYTETAIVYLEKYMAKKSDQELEALSGNGSQFAKDELDRRANMTPEFSTPTPKELFAGKAVALVN